MHACVLGVNGIEVVLARQVGVGHVAFDAQFFGETDQDFDIAKVQSALEEGREQQFNGFVLAAQGVGQPHQAMRVRGIGRAFDFIEREVDTFAFPRISQRFRDSVVLVTPAELALQVLAAVDALRRKVRVQQERAITHLRFEVRAQTQGPVEAPLADETPGTYRVEHNIYAHRIASDRLTRILERFAMRLNEKAAESSANPTFREALRFWLKLGFISFGGPAGQIAIMQHELVDNRRWIGQNAFLQALNFCMLLPGPEAQQLATYIGWKLHGLKGGLAAGILFVLPGALFLYALAWLAAAHGDSGPVAAVFAGLKPVVVALVLHALWRIGSKTLKTWLAGGLAVGAFAAIEIAGLPFPLVILLAGLIGWMTVRGQGAAVPVETPVGKLEVAAGWTYVLRMALIYVVLLALPLLAVVAFAGPDPFLTLGRFFTQAAFVTFGGAYAVLPYVADAAVNQFQWLSPSDMMNGLALAESTPGPLILVLQYVGFFAGWNAPGNLTPLAAATLAAIITTYATFLPSIFLILTGAPFVERIARVKAAAGALSAITAAVVGVIGTLTLFFAREVLLREGGVDFVAVAATLAAFLMLVRFKMGLHWVVLAGAVFGLVRASIF